METRSADVNFGIPDLHSTEIHRGTEQATITHVLSFGQESKVFFGSRRELFADRQPYTRLRGGFE